MVLTIAREQLHMVLTIASMYFFIPYKEGENHTILVGSYQNMTPKGVKILM